MPVGLGSRFFLGAVFTWRNRGFVAMSRTRNEVKALAAELNMTTKQTMLLNRSMMNMTLGMRKMFIGAFMVAVPTALGVFAGQFEESFERVRLIMQLTAREDIKRLREEMDRLGRETVFTPYQIAQGFKNLALQGLGLTQSIETLNAATRLAFAGEMDLAAASDTLASTMRAFNLDMGEANRIADMLAATATMTRLEFNELQGALGATAGAAAKTGQSLEMTLAMIGAIRGMGRTAQRAAQQVRMAFTNIAKTKSLTMLYKIFKGEREKFLIVDKKGNARLLDFITIMKNMRQELKGTTTVFQTAIAQYLLGERASDAYALMLKKNVTMTVKGVTMTFKDGAAALEFMIQAIRGSEGALRRLEEAMLKTLPGRMKLFQGSLALLGKSLGQDLVGALKAVLGTTKTPGLISFTNWLQRLTATKTGKGIVKVAGLTVLFGGAILFFSGALRLMFGALQYATWGMMSYKATLVPVIKTVMLGGKWIMWFTKGLITYRSVAAAAQVANAGLATSFLAASVSAGLLYAAVLGIIATIGYLIYLAVKLIRINKQVKEAESRATAMTESTLSKWAGRTVEIPETMKVPIGGGYYTKAAPITKAEYAIAPIKYAPTKEIARARAEAYLVDIRRPSLGLPEETVKIISDAIWDGFNRVWEEGLEVRMDGKDVGYMIERRKKQAREGAGKKQPTSGRLITESPSPYPLE